MSRRPQRVASASRAHQARLLTLQATAGNRAVSDAIRNHDPIVLQRAPGGGSPSTGASTLASSRQDLIRRVDQGSDLSEPIVIEEIAGAEVEALSLESMLVLESHVKAKIGTIEPQSDASLGYAEWVRLARRFVTSTLRPRIERRLEGVVATEVFWPVLDTAMEQLKGNQAALLARVAPLMWKIVQSGFGAELTAAERVRGGYLTPAMVERIVDPKSRFFSDEAMAKHMYNGAALFAAQLRLDGKRDTPRGAAARLVREVRDVHRLFEAALTEAYRQTGETVWGPAKTLRAALADHAERHPDSILSVMGIEHRTAARDPDEEMAAAIHEISTISGLPAGTGALVEAESDGSWFPAKVLATRPGGDRYVHYTGYSADWDEWLPVSRIRTRTAVQEGDHAWARWRTAVYPVRVLEMGAGEQAGKIRVHWLGFGHADDKHWIKASLVRGFR